MTEAIQEVRSTPGIEEGKEYPGIVVDDADPLFLQRVKARISTLHEGIVDDHLPWAIPDISVHTNGATATTGSVDVPLKGSKVWVSFQDGSIQHPKYSGYHTDQTTVIEESKLNYPKRRVMKFKDGSLLVVDVSNSTIYIRGVGNVKAYVGGNVELHIHGNVDEIVDGSVRRLIKGNLDEVIQGSVKRVIQGNLDEVVQGNASRSVAGSVNESTSGQTTVSFNGLAETVTGSAHRHADDLALSSSGSAVLFGSGSVTVEGSAVTVEGGSVALNPHGGSANPGSPGGPSSAANAADAELTEWPGFPGGESGS